MSISELLKQLDTLELPKDKYAITSSGVLAMRGIREANDLDLIVTPDLWEMLEIRYPVVDHGSFHSIDIGKIQILGQGSYYTDPNVATAEKQINDAEIIEGYPCVKLSYIREIKLNIGSAKDLKDVSLIDQYI